MSQKKVILVTGASKGIGKEIATALASRQHTVYASMRSPQDCDAFSSLPKEIQRHIQKITLDVTKEVTIKKAIDLIQKETGRIDVLVNNAGYGLFSPIELASDADLFKQFDVNVFGVVRLCRSIVPIMQKQKSGQIINISSVSGIVSNPMLGIYAASKHALEAISESLAVALIPWNIRVNVVEPTSTDTDFAAEMPASEGLKTENPYTEFANDYRKEFEKRMGKGQDPKEVGQLVADILENPNSDFRNQTNLRSKEIIAGVLRDPTGNEWLREAMDRYGYTQTP